MAWLPIQGIVPQGTESGNQANGYVLKFYDVGTTTPKSVATDSTGGTTTTDFLYDDEGYTTLSGSKVIPHVDSTYKIVLYLNQTDANANATGSAVYIQDNIGVAASTAASISYDNTTSGLTATDVQAAIDEVDANVDTNTASISTNATNIANNAADIASLIFKGNIFGLITSNGTDTEHDIDVTAGVVVDSTGAKIMTLGTTTTEVDNAIGTGNGGFPSALTLTADTWYHLFIVSEADGTNPKLGFDTSLSATNVLSDWTTQAAGTYTLFRRIASVLTDSSSNILSYYQFGDKFIWDVGVQDVSETLTVTTEQLKTVSTPSGISTDAIISFTANSNSTTSKYWLITSPLITDSTPSVTAFNGIVCLWNYF